jgi:Na+-driven multidrug efflux pump
VHTCEVTRATREHRRAMLLAIGAFVPVAALTLRFHWLGLPGIWAALGLWLAARSALLGKRWREATRSFGIQKIIIPNGPVVAPSATTEHRAGANQPPD